MQSSEKGHGRDEYRTYAIRPVPESVKDLERWNLVKVIGMSTNITVRDSKEQTESVTALAA